MRYTANVLSVMIASPSDIPEARDAVESAIHGWSVRHGRAREVVLQPWRWEVSAIPVLDDGPQQIINRQGVDQSDIVIALFGSRMGSPTAEALSGTAEEIQRAVDRGVPVHCYFSTGPLPNDVDTTQLDALRDFKQQLQDRGVLGEFGSTSELNNLVWQAVEYDIDQMSLGVPVLSAKSGVQFVVQPRSEREVSDYDKKGKPKYRTRHWLEVTNSSSDDAAQVRLEWVGDVGAAPLGVGPTTIHAGQTRTFPYIALYGGGDPLVVKVRWSDDGDEKERDFHV